MAATVKRNKKESPANKVIVGHNYASGHICDGESCEVCFPGMKALNDMRKFSVAKWQTSRRVDVCHRRLRINVDPSF